MYEKERHKTAILDSNGAVVVRYIYDAWGNHAVVDANGKDLEYKENDEKNNKYYELSQLNPFRYRGYYYDTETGLYFLKTRYYDPEIGRFITIDDLQYLDPETINGLNLYAYCANNPVMAVDPDGTLPKWLGWLLTGILLIALTVATICTFGAAAPITGLAATMVVGATIGAFIGTGCSIISQGINNGWNNIDGFQVFRDCLGGAVSGAISAINPGEGFVGFVNAFFLGGAASVAGGMISGSVTDLKSMGKAFVIGGFANIVAKGISDLFLNSKANEIYNMGPKSKSLAVQKLQSSPFNMGASAMKGSMRNSFKNVSLDSIKTLISRANFMYRLGIYSSLFSAIMSSN